VCKAYSSIVNLYCYSCTCCCG